MTGIGAEGDAFRVLGIDHVHVEVADRETAADWYRRVLGLVRDPAFDDWAADPMGPMMLSTPAGEPVLALFARDAKPSSRDSTVAFRVSGPAFRSFLGRLPSLGLVHRSGRPLAGDDVVDHGLSRSIYFPDPDGNPIEITTYDTEV